MTLVVLHGGNGAAAAMAPLIELLPAGMPVFAPDFLGHGGRPVPDGHSLADIADDLIAQCDAQGIEQADWFGYSFGGFVALWLALHHPARVRSLTTLAAKFWYDDRTVDHFTYLVRPERLSREGNPRAAQLAELHAPEDWRRVALNERELYASFRDNPPITEQQLRGLTLPALLIAGTADPIVSSSETSRIARLLPNAKAHLLPGSSHPLPDAPLADIVRALTRFLADPAAMAATGKVSLAGFGAGRFR